MGSLTRIVAHQGGWDEALPYVAPFAVFGALIWAAVVKQRRTRPSDGPPADGRPSDHEGSAVR